MIKNGCLLGYRDTEIEDGDEFDLTTDRQA